MSIMGTIALAGIVVNNSVLLVDFVNRYHARPGCSHSRWSALIRAGRTRFRPVFLTVATTVIGLMGLATTSQGQEQFLAPMAQAIIWGLCFATCLTLIFIPCLYAIVDDIKILTTRKKLTPAPETFPSIFPAPRKS
jgi:multidrug efflux pump subunit AcrB